MTPDIISRIIGVVVFAVISALIGTDVVERMGEDVVQALGFTGDVTVFMFMLVGVLFGLIATPWLTVRPFRAARHAINEMSVELLVAKLAGIAAGLGVALLLVYPLSLLNTPFGNLLPAAVSIAGAYLGMTIFSVRRREIGLFFSDYFGARRSRIFSVQSSRQLLLDTSVLIDGRIVEIAETGFLGGSLVIPRFVLGELHQVADSSDALRRNRGRRGLEKLNELQRNSLTPVKIVEEDVEEITEVDNKLVALAIQMSASIVTNDFNLNQVAEAQGVMVLNINNLANAVRSIYIPGESFPIRIIQEGRDAGQGVGYLEDGTMVVVERGSSHMDRTIHVEVTKLINRPTGRMIFAMPKNNGRG